MLVRSTGTSRQGQLRPPARTRLTQAETRDWIEQGPVGLELPDLRRGCATVVEHNGRPSRACIARGGHALTEHFKHSAREHTPLLSGGLIAAPYLNFIAIACTTRTIVNTRSTAISNGP